MTKLLKYYYNPAVFLVLCRILLMGMFTCKFMSSVISLHGVLICSLERSCTSCVKCNVGESYHIVAYC